MEGTTIKIRFDHEGCHATIHNADDALVAGAYEYVRTAGSWGACRDAAIEKAKDNARELAAFGPAPDGETINA